VGSTTLQVIMTKGFRMESLRGVRRCLNTKMFIVEDEWELKT
jgi:hypothetical protein